MILKISVENYKSFDKREELSMISSSKIQTNKNHRIKIKQVNVLKNAVVYGANASGKTNLVDVLRFIKETLSRGLPINSVNSFCRKTRKTKSEKVYLKFSLLLRIDSMLMAFPQCLVAERLRKSGCTS